MLESGLRVSRTHGNESFGLFEIICRAREKLREETAVYTAVALAVYIESKNRPHVFVYSKVDVVCYGIFIWLVRHRSLLVVNTDIITFCSVDVACTLSTFNHYSLASHSIFFLRYITIFKTSYFFLFCFVAVTVCTEHIILVCVFTLLFN